MSLDPFAQPGGNRGSGGSVDDPYEDDLAPMDKAAPAHWSFWSYLWRYALFAIPFSVMGMFIGMLESTGYRDLYGLDMLANIAASGLGIGMLGLVIGFGVALTVFTATTPARRLWAGHRAAGWTTAQCNSALKLQRYEAQASKTKATQREPGLEPMHSPMSAPARVAGTSSARRRADTPRKRGLTRIPTPVNFALLFIMFGVFLTVVFSPLLDRRDVQTVRCEIVSAEPRTSSGGSRGSASTASVLVETSCGPINVNRGVNLDNREEIAASFGPGSEYDFELGWFSRVVMKDLLGDLPTADHYRLVE